MEILLRSREDLLTGKLADENIPAVKISKINKWQDDEVFESVEYIGQQSLS